jgi:copper chaperone CopZ
MMKNIYILLLGAIFMVSGSNAMADENHVHDRGEALVSVGDNLFYKDEITVYVNGMVCDFCARALEKVFGGEASVEKIDVNLDDGLITVLMKKGQNLGAQKLIELITNSGYDVDRIEGATIK